MPVSAEWIVEGRVLYNHLTDPYTDDEVVSGSDVVVKQLDSVSQPVFFVINTLGLTTFPRNVVRAAQSVQKWMGHPNMRQLIVVSNNSGVRFISLLATQVQRNKVILHGSMSETLAYIAKQLPEIAEQIKPPAV